MFSAHWHVIGAADATPFKTADQMAWNLEAFSVLNALSLQSPGIVTTPIGIIYSRAGTYFKYIFLHAMKKNNGAI